MTYMNKWKYSTDPNELFAEDQANMSSSDEPKYLFRVCAVNMVLSRSPAAQVAASAGVTSAAVNW